ncbi:MAG: hypothetical protein RLZZ238_795 [Planctomycetota bacterium]
MLSDRDMPFFTLHEERYGRVVSPYSDAPPDAWIDASLLAHAEAVGEEVAPVLVAARDAVRAHGDDTSRAVLDEASRGNSAVPIMARLRAILSKRPGPAERAAKALVHFVRGEMFIALAHEIPGAGARATVRIATRDRLEPALCGARRIRELPPELRPRWLGAGHAADPVSIWRTEPPTCFEGEHHLAVEIAPSPSSFGEAMLLAHLGAARTLVLLVQRDRRDEIPTPTIASVLPSGWSYLRGDDRVAAHPNYPNGAPLPRGFVRVPDPDLFALCAARTWTGSLADAIWLRRRDDFRALC